jgi:tetratricopeptide (TPR) repeat protein
VVVAAVCLLGTLVVLVVSVGWVLSEQAARQREAEAMVREALGAVEPGLRQGNPWDPALTSAIRRAEAQLNGGTIAEELRQRVQRSRKDVQMLAELERIRLDQSWGFDEKIDHTGSDSQYAKAFRTYGIDAETLDPVEGASLVQKSAICEHLVAGLDYWAYCITSVDKELTGRKVEHLLAIARNVDPDPWRNRLRELVSSEDTWQPERIVDYRFLDQLDRLAASALVEQLPLATLGQLAHAIAATKPTALMVDSLRRAQRRFPADFWLNSDLSLALTHVGGAQQKEEAIGFSRAALALRPQSPAAHVNLGILLCRGNKDPDGAIAEFSEAIRLRADYGRAHSWVGIVLCDLKGDMDGAIAAFRVAIACDPNYAKAHNRLGEALLVRKDLGGGIVEFRKAIALDPRNLNHRRKLFFALLEKGDLDGAINECHEEMRIKLDNDFTRWHFENVHRFVELDAKLPRILKGEIQPADNKERLAWAEYCQRPCKSLYSAACRFYVDAFSKEQHLADPPGRLRYNAACAAALAGCGQGNDADQTDAKERVRLRWQALDWQRADLAAWRQLFEKEPDKVRPDVVQIMLQWLENKDFAGVRGEAMSKLPEAERLEWQKLWQEVEALRQRAVEPPKKAGP